MNDNTNKPTSWPFTAKMTVSQPVTVEFSKVDDLVGADLRPDHQVFAPLNNYYGRPSVFAYKGRFFMALGDVCGGRCVEISKPLYDAFVADFGALSIPAGTQEEDSLADGFQVVDANREAAAIISNHEAYLQMMKDWKSED
jgi:hypothetical protein